MGVSDSDYPGNEADAPRALPSPAQGVTRSWRPLVTDDESMPEPASWLSTEQRTRVARFGRPLPTRRYPIKCAARRSVIAARLGLEPQDVPLARDPATLLDDKSRRPAFLRLCTCEEAMGRATGDALGAPPFRPMDVTLDQRIALVDGPAPYVLAPRALHGAAPACANSVGTAALWAAPAGSE